MQMLEAIFAGIALAFWVAVWAIRPSKGDSGLKGKEPPLDRTPTRKGDAR